MSKSKDELFGCFAVLMLLGMLGTGFIVTAIGSVISSAQNQAYDIDTIRQSGLDAGYADGVRAGREDGIANTTRVAYGAEVTRVQATGKYFLMPIYCVGIALAAFMSGFYLQFATFYFLRRLGLLSDIDRLLLSRSSTVAKLS